MTSASFAASTNEHPEVAEISALTEGILPPTRSADVRSHLSGCALCVDVKASLDNVRDILRALPSPASMPDDVAGRIDAALAAEALLDATASHVSRETPGYLSQPTQVPEGLTATAKAGKAQPVSAKVSRETSRPASPRPHRSRSTGEPKLNSRWRNRRWRHAALGTVGLVGVVALGGLFIELPSDTSNSSPHQDIAAKNSSSPDLKKWVRSTLAKEASGGSTHHQAQEVQEGNANAPLLSDSRPGLRLPSCVRAGIGRTENPLAVDKRSSDGADVYLVVLPHSGDAQRVDVYVMDSACTGDGAARQARVLTTATYQRS